MANSSVIGTAKNKIIKMLIKDPQFVKAIDSQDIKPNETEKLIGTHIFDFHQNPFTLKSSGTFITIEIDIPEVYANYRTASFVKATIIIWIFSHERHMRVTNIPKVTINRNDYIAELIDNKLNGITDIGLGRLEMTSNTGGSFQQDYLYRKITFETTDLNNSVCKFPTNP